jgi:anti-sigma regulatory factor (Ser/Thr protein kinase)
VPEEVADDIVVALNEAATNAMLYGSRGRQPIQVLFASPMAGWRRRCWIMARSRRLGAQPIPQR